MRTNSLRNKPKGTLPPIWVPRNIFARGLIVLLCRQPGQLAPVSLASSTENTTNMNSVGRTGKAARHNHDAEGAERKEDEDL